MADKLPTPWRHKAAKWAVEASTGTTYWTVVPAPPTPRGTRQPPTSDLVAPPVLVGAAPVHP